MPVAYFHPNMWRKQAGLYVRQKTFEKLPPRLVGQVRELFGTENHWGKVNSLANPRRVLICPGNISFFFFFLFSGATFMSPFVVFSYIFTFRGASLRKEPQIAPSPRPQKVPGFRCSPNIRFCCRHLGKSHKPLDLDLASQSSNTF